jgi:hypothetical protein
MLARGVMFLAEGFLAALHPWFAVIVLVLNWIAKPEVKYHIKMQTNVLFLAGLLVGFVLGCGLFDIYLQWWWNYKGDLLRIVVGSRPVWAPHGTVWPWNLGNPQGV